MIEREQGAVQELYGLNIIRGEGMIEGTNKGDFIVGNLLADTVIGRDGSDEIQIFLGIDQAYAEDGDNSGWSRWRPTLRAERRRQYSRRTIR
jgi:hypothetical protein